MSAPRNIVSIIGLAVLAWAVILTATLSGCAAVQAGPSQQRVVYQAEGDFAAALPLALAYEGLPTCSAAQKAPCADPLLVTRLTAAARAARASLSTAEGLVRAKSSVEQVSAALSKAGQDVSAFKSLAAAVSQ